MYLLKINKIDESKVIVIPEKSLDFNNSGEVKERLLSLNEEGFKEIIIDFSNVESIDSFGLGKLLVVNKIIRENNARLKLVNIESEYILNTFEMIKLNRVIDIEGLE